MNLKNIIIAKLFMINAIKKGNFTLKSGEKSEYYFDMRVIMSYPNIYKLLLDYALIKFPDLLNDIDIICGVEFGGLPLANFISHKMNIPQIIVRKEAKTYGTNKQIEGYYTQSSKLLLIEDVVTTGGSIIEKINQIGNQVMLHKILVILDRRENPVNFADNCLFYNLFTINDIKSYTLLNDNMFYENTMSDKIYKLAIQKQSNIILSCDLGTGNEILDIVEKLGTQLVGIKLHINTLSDFNVDFIEQLLKLKNMYNFIIIEDGKYADIGNIVIKQLTSFEHIHNWADLITIHSVTGEGIIDAVSDKYPNLGLLLISELSTKNNLIDDNYIKNSVDIYKNKNTKLTGFVCQNKTFNYVNKFETLTFSPGINFNTTGDKYDQTYKNPNDKTTQTGLFWIIGRGIYESTDVVSSCEEYRENGWEYFKRF